MARQSVAAALVLAAALATAAPAAAQSGELPSPGISPPRANDFSCQPSGAHRFPVVLVHGTAADMTISWNLISPKLARDGYCVFALDYGGRGFGRIQDSARRLRDFVDRVLEATGARKVAIVGHSQGGMMPRWYIKHLGGASKVSELVGLAASNHGTTTPLAPLVGATGLCDACDQQIAGSRFITRLNRGDETPGRIDYTVVSTRLDEVVTPFASQALKGPRTTNVVLQDRCPLDLFEHIGIIYDPVAFQWVENALASGGPADPDFKPKCLLGR